MVIHPTFIAAVQVGAKINISFLIFSNTRLSNVVFQVPAFPVKKTLFSHNLTAFMNFVEILSNSIFCI
jgi:hypothetical protein